MSLTSFHAANVAVIGASGGIGAVLCRALATDPQVASLYALSRQPSEHAAGLHVPLDYAEEASIAAAAAQCASAAPLDLVIVATGILHDKNLQPEKTLRQLDAVAMQTVLQVNTVGPALVAKHFLPRLAKDHKTVFAALSARVGSINDNRLGGWTSYRASKAALNMVLKTLAIEQARRWPQSVIAALHPGTVDTPLSQPFSRRVPAGALFSADTAAQQLLTVIDQLDAKDSGGFFAWDGQPINY